MARKAVVIKQPETNSYFRQCEGKERYSKKEAITAAKKVIQRGRQRQMGVYPCDFCMCWHLTHNPYNNS